MRLVVSSDDAGQRLDRWLASIDGVGSRSRAERLIADGQVTIDDQPVLKSHRLVEGDIVEVEAGSLTEERLIGDIDVDLTILHEDEHLLVIDKPAGIVVHPAPGLDEVTMTDLLSAGGIELAPDDDAQVNRPGVVHRLDRDTSGAMVFARTATAMRRLQEMIRERSVRREYVALVHGHLASRAGRIEAPIGRHWRDPTRQSIETENPRDAITHFVVEEVHPHTTLLRLRLETGRTHQIRVHLSAIGHPVVADHLYGGATRTWGLDRQFLHSARLAFEHPVMEGVHVDVTSPLPEDLRSCLTRAQTETVDG